MAAIVFILYVVSTGNLPDFTALAAYPSAAACKSAADAVNTALKSGEDAKTAICLTSESLGELAKENDVSGK